MSRYWKIFMHITWGTADRKHVLFGELEKATHTAIRDAIREMDMVPICVNSAWNHTHSLVSWNPANSVDEAVELMKDSAVEAWDKLREEKYPSKPELCLQEGFSAFSVSPKNVEEVKDYIVNQKKRHSDANTVKMYEMWSTL